MGVGTIGGGCVAVINSSWVGVDVGLICFELNMEQDTVRINIGINMMPRGNRLFVFLFCMAFL